MNEIHYSYIYTYHLLSHQLQDLYLTDLPGHIKTTVSVTT